MNRCVIESALLVLLAAIATTATPGVRASAGTTATTTGATNTAPLDSFAVYNKARALTPYVSRGESGPLWALFDEKMRTAMGDSLHFDATMVAIHSEVGTLKRVLAEHVTAEQGMWIYEARCQFERSEDPVRFLVAFDPDGGVAGLAIRPEAHVYPSTKLGYVTKTTLHLPFRGEWYVFWGGRTFDQNHHATSKNERFANDLAIVKDGVTHTGDGKKLTDYYAYGAEVLAPAAGTVVWACDSLSDQTAGVMDTAHPVGNGVVIDHGNGEFSVLGHMQMHSLRVKKGDHVAADQVLGLCGNSGQSTEPHILYFMQDGPDFATAEGLPVRFADLVVDGKPVKSEELVRGQVVSRATATGP